MTFKIVAVTTLCTLSVALQAIGRRVLSTRVSRLETLNVDTGNDAIETAANQALHYRIK